MATRRQRERIARVVRKVETERSRPPPQQAKFATQDGWVLVVLSEDMTGSAPVKAKIRFTTGPGGTWKTDDVEFDVYPWKPSGTLLAGWEVWCRWWSGQWLVLIPEQCPV